MSLGSLPDVSFYKQGYNVLSKQLVDAHVVAEEEPKPEVVYVVI